MKKTITLLILLALAIPAWAGEQTITISRNDGQYNSAEGVYYASKGGVTMKMSGGLNNINYLVLRHTNTVSFESANYPIKKIIFHCLDNFPSSNLDVFYWGPSTMNVMPVQLYGTSTSVTPGKFTASGYDGTWTSDFTGTWTSVFRNTDATDEETRTHTSYPNGWPVGNSLIFGSRGKPIRFSSIDIVIEKENGDIYDLVTSNDEIQENQTYVLVSQYASKALSTGEVDGPTADPTKTIASTPVTFPVADKSKVRTTSDVQLITLEHPQWYDNRPWLLKVGGNYIKRRNGESNRSNVSDNRGWNLQKVSAGNLPTTESDMNWYYFRVSISVSGNINNNALIRFYHTDTEAGGSSYTYAIRHRNGDGCFRDIDYSSANNYAANQRVYLYKPAQNYKVYTQVSPTADCGSISLRDGIIVANGENTSQKFETVSFLVTPADGKKIAGITIANNNDPTVVIPQENITITQTTGGTLYSFEMPGNDVLITATFEDVTYHNVNIVVKPNVAYGNVFLTEGYVVQQDQVKSYDGETVVFNVTPNPKDPDNANSEYYELYSVVVKNDITGEEIPYTYADGNYTFTMPDANVTITATFIYENGAPLYLLGTANGNETWLPYGPRFNYDPNEGQYYLDVYFKGVGEYGDTENYDQYGYFSFVWKYATSWDEINNKNLRGVPMTNGTMVDTSSGGFQLFYNPRNNANESNSFKIPAGIYRFYLKSYSEGNDWLYVTQSPISLTYNPAGGADAASAVEVPLHQLVTMSGDLYSKIKAINPDESDDNFKYKATIGGVTEPQTEIAGAITSNIATLDVVNDGETVTELAGTNYLGWIHADKTAYYKVINTPLNWIERNGEKGKTYTVADQLQGVYAKDGHLWCKDLGDISIVKTEPATGQVDYVTSTLNTLNHRFENNMRNGNWDQSNWVELDFTGVTNDAVNVAQSFVNKLITAGSVKGVYSDDVNYTITLTSLPTMGGGATYVPNTYYTNNFIEANLTATGVAEGGMNYYFLNPKVQEYAIITYAMWDVYNQIMVAPSISPFNGAAVLGRWDLNESGNELERLNAAAHTTATANNEYEFHIIVQRANKSYGSAATTTQGVAGLKVETPTPKAGQTASAVIMAQPLDLQASSPLPTAINGVVSNAQPVNVEYINLAGVRSSKPFSGVNIVVTRYTDGSTTTTKVIRK